MATCKICGKPVTAGPVYHAECLEKSSGWISVEDRLPDCREIVLAFSPEFKEYMMGQVFEWAHTVVCESDVYVLIKVTHWMPLPEPPGKEG